MSCPIFKSWISEANFILLLLRENRRALRDSYGIFPFTQNIHKIFTPLRLGSFIIGQNIILLCLIFKEFIYKEFEHRWKDVNKLRVFTLKKKSNKTFGRLFFLSKNEEILVLEAQFIIPYRKSQ